MEHVGFNIQLRRQLSTKINMSKSSPTTQKCGQGNLTRRYSTISHQPGTPSGHTMDIYITGSRVVPWGWNIHLPSQMSMNHTKVKDFLKILNPFALIRDTLGAH